MKGICSGKCPQCLACDRVDHSRRDKSDNVSSAILERKFTSDCFVETGTVEYRIQALFKHVEKYCFISLCIGLNRK